MIKVVKIIDGMLGECCRTLPKKLLVLLSSVAESLLRSLHELHEIISENCSLTPQVPFCSTKAQVIGTFNQFDPSKFLFVPQKPKHVLVSCN